MGYIVALALLIRVVVSSLTFLISRDGVRFIEVACSLAANDMHRIVAEQYHPLYPFFIYLVHFISPDWSVAARMAAIIMGGLTVIPLFYISKTLFDKRVAIITTLVYAFHPYAVRYSADALSESTYIFFFLCALWVGYKACHDKLRPLLALCAGVLVGCAYLTRPEGLGMMLIVGATIVLRRYSVSYKGQFLKKTVAVFLLITGVVVCSFPYTYILKQETGQWRITTKKSIGDFIPSFIRNKFIDQTDTQSDSTNIQSMQAVPSAPTDTLQVMPQESSEKFFGNLKHRLTALGEVILSFINTYHQLLIAFLLIGAIWGLRKTSRDQRFLLVMIIATFLLYGYVLYRLALLHYISKRHVMPLVTLALPFCGCGINFIAQSSWFGRFFKGRIKPVYALVVCVLLVLAPKTFKPLRGDEQFIKDVANWLVINAELRGLYAAEDPRVAFYAHLPFIQLPKCYIVNDELLNFFNVNNIDFLVLSKEYADEYLPDLHLLEDENKLKLISIYKYTDTTTGKKYLLYEYLRGSRRQ